MNGAFLKNRVALVTGGGGADALRGAGGSRARRHLQRHWSDLGKLLWFRYDWMDAIARTQEERKGEEYLADAQATNPRVRLIEPGEDRTLARCLCADGPSACPRRT